MRYFYALIPVVVVVFALLCAKPRPAHSAEPVDTCVWPHVC